LSRGGPATRARLKGNGETCAARRLETKKKKNFRRETGGPCKKNGAKARETRPWKGDFPPSFFGRVRREKGKGFQAEWVSEKVLFREGAKK